MDETQKDRRKKSLTGCALLALLAVVALTVISIWGPSEDPISSQRAEPSLDASGLFACRDFLKLMEDVQAGVLTDSEMRERGKAIRENSRISASEEVRKGGDELLRSMTMGTPAEVQEAFIQMTQACSKRAVRLQKDDE